MLILIIAATVGLGVAAVIGAVALAVRGDERSVAEDRLSTLTAGGRHNDAKTTDSAVVLRNSFDGTRSAFEMWLSDRFDLQQNLEQADIKLSVTQFTMICAATGGAAMLACLFAPVPKFLAPLPGLIFFFVPFLWVKFMKAKRIAKFNSQLPEALEMLSRSLRAGHSLGAGFGLIAEEMPEPLAAEFGRCFEEQNLGISLEQTLESMTKRIPNLDLRFFATAVILQRQTGGDLAEILDKIGRLIRARFRLAGTIQALTGEGRLSGIVLLALPPGLFVMMLFVNREYIMKLFTDPMGQWMLGGAILMQFMGALVIRKIIDIEV